MLLPESELTPVSLAALLRELLEAGRPRLMAMAEAARRTAIIDADERLADACIAAAGVAAAAVADPATLGIPAAWMPYVRLVAFVAAVVGGKMGMSPAPLARNIDGGK